MAAKSKPKTDETKAVVSNQGEASTGVREPKTEELAGNTTKVTY